MIKLDTKTIVTIGVFPEMGNVPPAKMIADAGCRVLIVEDYLCFYQVVDDEIFIYHIVHGSADYIRRLF